MKALLSTTLALSAVTLGSLTLAVAMLAAVIVATSPGFAADAAIPQNFAAPAEFAEFQAGVVPNRLDIYDFRRELAREAEHDRIRTRLGDPFRWCRPAGLRDDFGMPYSGPPLIVCR
jgi:hypothetical protein